MPAILRLPTPPAHFKVTRISDGHVLFPPLEPPPLPPPNLLTPFEFCTFDLFGFSFSAFSMIFTTKKRITFVLIRLFFYNDDHHHQSIHSIAISFFHFEVLIVFLINLFYIHCACLSEKHPITLRHTLANLERLS